MAPQNLLIFDGECLLCSRLIAFVLAHERSADLHFSPSQSKQGAWLLRQAGLDPADPTSMLLLLGGQRYLASDAVLAITERLHWPWRVLTILHWLPRTWRDGAYGLIARNRYRWFGRSAFCYQPGPADRHRFL